MMTPPTPVLCRRSFVGGILATVTFNALPRRRRPPIESAHALIWGAGSYRLAFYPTAADAPPMSGALDCPTADGSGVFRLTPIEGGPVR